MNSTAKGRNRGTESFLQRIGLDLGHVPAAATIGRLFWVSRHINQKGYFRTKMERRKQLKLVLRLRSSNPSTKQRVVKRLDLQRPQEMRLSIAVDTG